MLGNNQRTNTGYFCSIITANIYRVFALNTGLSTTPQEGTIYKHTRTLGLIENTKVAT